MSKVVCVSGGFDPLHVGHLRMFKEAAKYGDLVVILNSDNWLLRKKGYVFMNWEERAELIANYPFVSCVAPVIDQDGTVCEALMRIKPDYFANGGDRLPLNTPEGHICSEIGIEMLFNVGGGKVQSSSDLVKKCLN